MNSHKLVDIATRIIADREYILSRDEISTIIEMPREDIHILFACAAGITRKYCGNWVNVCSVINARSGSCSEDCAFCAQSRYHRTGVKTYPLLSAEKMAQAAIELHKNGARFFSFVTSGYSVSEQDIKVIQEAVAIIRRETDLTLCASLGNLTKSLAAQLREAGIQTYHHNLETARSFFPQICTTHSYDEDVNTVLIAKEHGFTVCCGGIFGLGESWEQRVELALTLRDLDVDKVPLNLLIPIPGTRLEAQPLLEPLEALKIVALYRFLLPDKVLIMCGGREVVLRDLQSWALMAGANGIMVGNYLTTSGRNIQDDLSMLRDLGLETEMKEGQLL
ncbi:MAG: Biotin synthase [Thermoanaerobacterales bacterium 50_218]|nr:MAG: Biotin synthase [Thermoanaerobacterales bacterium 50_218]